MGISGWNRATTQHSDVFAVYSLLVSADLVQSAPQPNMRVVISIPDRGGDDLLCLQLLESQTFPDILDLIS